MLLHDTRNDDAIKAFLQGVHELYLKVPDWPIPCLCSGPMRSPCARWCAQVMLNPFYELGEPITSVAFAQKVYELGRSSL
jgi:hypothetical protein